MSVPRRCPWCSSKRIQIHCASRGCEWITCKDCSHYGTEDGKRKAPIQS